MSSTPIIGRRLLATTPLPDIAPEPDRSVVVGLAMHLGPAMVFVAWCAATGFGVVSVLAGFLVVNLVYWAFVRHLELSQPDVALPAPTYADRTEGFVLVVLKGVVLGTLIVLATRWAAASVLPSFDVGFPWLAIALVVMGTDLVYYSTHRWLGHGRGAAPMVRWFRRNHNVHHQVEHLDFIRGNVSSTIDTAVTGFQVPAGLLAALLGLNVGTTLVAYVLILMLQATHHLNHTLNIGPMRWLFMDNHAHKLHHCPRGMLVNHGALFSVWDLALGTYFEDHRLGANALHASRTPLPIRWRMNRPRQVVASV